MLLSRLNEDAERCDRLAKVMLTAAQRDAYLEMGRMWRKLAVEMGNHRTRVAAWERRNGLKPSVPSEDQVEGEPVSAG
jgi:hypothetical protein